MVQVWQECAELAIQACIDLSPGMSKTSEAEGKKAPNKKKGAGGGGGAEGGVGTGDADESGVTETVTVVSNVQAVKGLLSANPCCTPEEASSRCSSFPLNH